MSNVKVVGEEVYVPDSTVVINGVLRRLLSEGKLLGRLVICRELIEYFEGLANDGRSLGFIGLEELRMIRALSSKHEVMIDYLAINKKFENVDTAILEFTYDLGGTLITSSRVQALAADVLGIKAYYVASTNEASLVLDKFFDKDTMSIHLKEGVKPLAKKGRPGRWYLVELDSNPLTRDDVELIANEVMELARNSLESIIEVDRLGSTIVQLGDYRVIITRPPMSDGWEITAVRPLVRPRLEDYKLPEKLLKRFEERAEGILIAGAPGMGKTTFAQALAEYYLRSKKVVKTIESPRDMKLPPQVTQYSKVYASSDELHDVLLLSRPDYTVFDEMRTDDDFKLYVDLRLAGIGMVGVVHATTPIDALQRFIRRVDLGMIPSIIDTVVFIDRGEVSKVYVVGMTVKLPTGLKEADLARPVVEVRDFLTDELEYEVYTFGEQTVVVPIKSLMKTGLERKLKNIISRDLPSAEVKIDGKSITVYVTKDELKHLRKAAKKLKRLEQDYGVEVDIKVIE
ncbi:MAG: PINc/VapC family ATPase [Sulfolobales archaeon]